MASTYRAEMSAPQIYPTGGMIGVLDQAKPSIFAAAIRQGDSYVRPSGNATFYFTVYRNRWIFCLFKSICRQKFLKCAVKILFNDIC